MRSIIKWAIRSSPGMNISVVVLIMIGSISMILMPREVFPNFELEILLVTVPFPGATPDEVEEGICQKIEAAVSSVDGVKKVSSVSSENAGFVILELESYVKDAQRVLNDVRSQIGQITTFPPRSEDPEVKQIVFRAPAITLGLIGPEPSDDPSIRLNQERQLRSLAESIREDIEDIGPVPPASMFRRPFAFLFQPSGSAVSQAEIVAAKPYEIGVEIPEATLQEYGLSLTRLANLIRLQNIEMPGGKMETAGEEVLLRGKSKRETGAEIAEIPVLTQPNGDVVTVGDLGVVIDGFAESVSEHVINGRPGLAIRVTKTSDEDLFTVVEAVKKYVDGKTLPAGYELKVWGDVSLDVKDRIRLLANNGTKGLIVVFIILALFLELRLAFWVALGIPISILGTGFVLVMFGQTLNMLTLFAFLMALGIVVDDAIVIGENIYAKREQGLSPIKASVEGTMEVLPSVASSVSTTIIAFFPLMFVSGVMGKFLAVMPLAVISMLIISLIEAILVLPSHLAHDNNLFIRVIGVALYVFKPVAWLIAKLNVLCSKLLDLIVRDLYQPVLNWCLSNKIVTCFAGFATLIIAVGLVAGGMAPIGVFPRIDSPELSATVAFPNGTSAEFARRATQQLEDAVHRVDERIKKEYGESVVVNIYRRIGEVGDSNRGPTGITNGSHVASVEVQLVRGRTIYPLGNDQEHVARRSSRNCWH
ncbi:MAG: efflux RND transporter permease subunit [Pirellulaceae bacterium]